MNEFKYYDIPSPFPTLARGLFTREIPSGNDGDGDGDGDGEVGVGDVDVGKGKKKKDEKRHQIVIRGYDKFFNIGEVPWTEVMIHFFFSYIYTLVMIHFFFSGPQLNHVQLLRTSSHSNPMDVSSSSQP